MDVLIKSFNRPYYLDRCLYSIYKYVQGVDNIVILDDGTPQKYLDKIQEKYPNITILYSENYKEKIQLTHTGTAPKGYKIPINLWLDAAKNTQDYFVLIEDDMWFIESISLSDIKQEMISNHTVMTKLIWLGSDDLIQSKKEVSKDSIVLLQPKLLTIIPILYKFIFYKFHRFKIKKIQSLLGLYTEKNRIAYYTLYSVAGQIFNKEYFLQLWKNHTNSVDEGLQMYNAVKLYYKSRNNFTFARYKNEVIKTGFISSATNEHKEEYNGNVNMFQFNKVMNEAWFYDVFNALESFPKDFSENQVQDALNSTFNTFELQFLDWQKWVSSFKLQYKKYGCNIE